MTLPLTARRHPRRLALLAIALVICVAASLAISHSVGHATTGASAYDAPDVVDTNPDPNIVETTLTAENATVDIGNGVMAHAADLQRRDPGPDLPAQRRRDGHRPLPEQARRRHSGIHWHGIELANAIDGTPFTQNHGPAGRDVPLQVHGHAAGDLLVPPAPPLARPTRSSGALRDDRRHGPQRGRAAGLRDPSPAAQTEADRAQRHDGLQARRHQRRRDLQPGAARGSAAARCRPRPSRRPGPVRGARPHARPAANADRDRRGRQRSAAPYAAGDIPAIQTDSPAARTNEGQTVLTNGKNVGGRAGTPGSPRRARRRRLDARCAAGQGLRLQLLNASAIRYMRLRLTDDSAALDPAVRVGGEGGLLNNAVEGGRHARALGSHRISTPARSCSPPGCAPTSSPRSRQSATGVLTMWTEDYQRTGHGLHRTSRPSR